MVAEILHNGILGAQVDVRGSGGGEAGNIAQASLKVAMKHLQFSSLSMS